MISKPPLNFLGNKNKFKDTLMNMFKNYSDDYIFVDLFGGSGYLSYIAKQTCKNNTVIYNDYDYYSDRIAHIEETQLILDEIKTMVINANILPEQKLNKELSDEIKKMLKDRENKEGYVDWITISNQLCFTMNTCHNYEEFNKMTLYNNLNKSKLQPNSDYLDGIDIVHMDWKVLYKKYKHDKNIVWLIDPPYPNTLVQQYKDNISNNDSLKLLNILHDKDNVYYFTSSRSNMLEVYKWKYGTEDNLKITKNINGSGRYRSYYDYCLYKNKFNV